MSALVKPVSLSLRVGSELGVSVEEGQEEFRHVCRGKKELQSPTHSIQFSQYLPCPTHSSLASLLCLHGRLGDGQTPLALLGEESDAQRLC